jgi:hypothetical protein
MQLDSGIFRVRIDNDPRIEGRKYVTFILQGFPSDGFSAGNQLSTFVPTNWREAKVLIANTIFSDNTDKTVVMCCLPSPNEQEPAFERMNAIDAVWSGSIANQIGSLWPEVRDLSRGEAVRYIHSLRSTARDRGAAVGLEFQGEFALTALPVLQAALLLYLLAHVRRLSATRKSYDSSDLTTAWAPLFPGADGLLIAIVGAAALPIYSVSSIVIRASSNPLFDYSEYKNLLFFVLIVSYVNAGISATVLAEIVFLRKHISR